MNSMNTLLIGVDGGATEVKAHAVECDDLTRPTTFELRAESAGRVYPTAEDFQPAPVNEQLAQRDADRIELSAEETAQGRSWVTAAAEAISAVARAGQAQRVLVGMGMPGLKTPDGRGICVMNNGPRIPRFLEMLEQALDDSGLTLAAPVAALGSDADYCGLGEEYAAAGLFRDVSNAYYAGCGTGIADAMKLRGDLVAFDDARSWIQKSWQMHCALGSTFEKLVSASALNRVYDAFRTSADGAVFPEVAAARGCSIARAWLDTAALVLAELIFERLWTIKNGRAENIQRGATYLKLERQHPYRGLLLERVIIGQRLGEIYRDARYHTIFSERLDHYLAAFIHDSGDAEMIATYTVSGRTQLKPGFVRASKLRAAPALGAAVAAVRALSG